MNSQGTAPKTSLRLILWVSIYLAAQVPMIWRLGPAYNPLSVFLFPLYLGMVVAIPLNLLPDAISHVLAFGLLPLGCLTGYVVYPLHFVATLRAQTRRRFSFLLLFLAAMVLMNQSIQWSMMHSISG